MAPADQQSEQTRTGGFTGCRAWPLVTDLPCHGTVLQPGRALRFPASFLLCSASSPWPAAVRQRLSVHASARRRAADRGRRRRGGAGRGRATWQSPTWGNAGQPLPRVIPPSAAWPIPAPSRFGSRASHLRPAPWPAGRVTGQAAPRPGLPVSRPACAAVLGSCRGRLATGLAETFGHGRYLAID